MGGPNPRVRADHGAMDFDEVGEEFGRLDILVNNAATNPYYGPAAELPPDAFDKTVDVNLKGPYYLMAGAVPLMIASGGEINMRGISSTIVTATPNVCIMHANSQPITPPPTMRSRFLSVIPSSIPPAGC